MTFLHPWVLLLIAAPVLLFWFVIGRTPGVVLPFDHQPSGSHARSLVEVWPGDI